MVFYSCGSKRNISSSRAATPLEEPNEQHFPGDLNYKYKYLKYKYLKYKYLKYKYKISSST